MKLNLPKLLFIATFCFGVTATLFVLLSFKAYKSAVSDTDTTYNKNVVREVLSSQDLFIVKMSRIKGKKNKFNLDAKLRNTFTVIRYTDDTTIVELDWILCPDGKCPEAKLYKEGTGESVRLDSVMKRAKAVLKINQRAMDNLRKGKINKFTL